MNKAVQRTDAPAKGLASDKSKTRNQRELMRVFITNQKD